MKNLLLLIVAVVFCLSSCEKSENPAQTSTKSTTDVTNLLINKSTIYKVEKTALWTTTLNQLQVITKFNVTASTQIYLNDLPSKLELLRPGYRVVIYYYENPLCTSVLPCYTAVKILAYSK